MKGTKWGFSIQISSNFWKHKNQRGKARNNRQGHQSRNVHSHEGDNNPSLNEGVTHASFSKSIFYQIKPKHVIWHKQ